MQFLSTPTLEKTIKEKFKTKKGKDRRTIQLKHFYPIHLICEYILKYEDLPDVGVFISTRNLTELFGKGSEVKRILDLLVKLKFIVLIRKGVREEYCSSYILHPSIANEGTITIPIQKDETPFIKKLGVKLEEDRSKFREHHEMMEKYITVSQDGIDHLEETYRDLPLKAMRRRDRSLQAIIDREFWVSRPDPKSRVYSNFTNLKREHRDYILINGKPLMATDISNSQILLTVKLIHDQWRKTHGNLDNLPSDVQEYQAISEGGKFYYVVQEDLGDAYKMVNISEFKKMVYAKLFFSRNNPDPDPIRDAFKKRFPTVSNMIWSFKKKKHNSFAIALQRFEASVVIDNVYKRMISEGKIVFTIHDAIVVHIDEDLEYAEMLIAEELLNYNISPHFKREGKIQLDEAA